MEKIPKLIITLIVILMIILIILLIILSNNKKQKKSEVIEEIVELAERNEELHTEGNRNRFYVVKDCVNKFYECYEKLNKENLDIKFSDDEIDYERIQKRYIEKMYAMLDKEYINYKNITVDNLADKLGKIGKVELLIDKVYTKDLQNSSYICFVEGRLKEQSKEIENFKMVVRLSGENTFKIFLEDYLEEKNYNEFSKDIDILQLCKENITNDTYNTYSSDAITTKQYINDLFEHYRITTKYNDEYSYQLIDEAYKKIRFQTKEEYLNYVKENEINIITTLLNSYSQHDINGITQYICKDNYGKYYIFNETAPFQYTVMLDNYTIPTEDFVKAYTSSTDAEKVVLNIKRFFMGIDDKNYGYSYNVLSNSFKNNQFNAKEDFINFAKQNFFEENKIKYLSYEEENGLYIYKIELTDATGKNQEQRTFNIIVKLNDGTDFEMSFSRE